MSEETKAQTIQKLKDCLDKGMTVIEARKVVPELNEFEFFPQEYFPDNYFSNKMEGKTHFSPSKIPKNKHLPKRGIILADGTIYDATLWHRMVSTWLKYNGVDLTNSLRYYFDIDTHEPVFKEGYDFYGPVKENDMSKLTSNWLEKHDWLTYIPVIAFTEQQAKTIFFLSRCHKLDFEKIFDTNHCFGMCQTQTFSPAEQKIGKDNNYTLNHLHFDHDEEIYY